MDQRLTEVEAKVASLNTQLTKLQELIDGKQFITGIEKNEDGNIVESIIVYQNPVTYPDDVMVLMMQPNAKDSGECLPASFGKAKVKANANEPAKGFYRF